MTTERGRTPIGSPTIVTDEDPNIDGDPDSPHGAPPPAHASSGPERATREPIVVPAAALPERRAVLSRDWRWAVGLLGRVLIVTGLLIFGFVAYQLWGTNIQEARAQDSLRSQFAAVLAKAGSPPTTVAPTTVAPTTVSPTIPATAVPTTVLGPATPAATIDPTQVAEGDPVARIEIPKIGVDKTVVSGVSVGALRKGPGHFPDTPFPGEDRKSVV